MTGKKSWRDDPTTKRQLAYIEEMCEYSTFPLPPFVGTTKGEACNYIGRWSKAAHEGFGFAGHGDRI